MNSSQTSAEEQLSAAFDHDAVSRTLRDAVGRDQADQLLDEWQQTGTLLRGLPVLSVSLESQVQRQLTEADVPNDAAVTVAAAQMPAGRYSTDHSARRRLALLTSCLAIAFLAFGIRTSLVDPLNRQFASGGLLSNAVDWQVVVLTVDDDAAESTARLMRDTVAELGLEVQPLADRHSARAQHDVLLAGAEESEAVLRSLQTSGGSILSTELNPSTVDGLDRKQLLDRLNESMRTPTRSDEFFGEMLVAVSVGDSVMVETIPAAGRTTRPGAAGGAVVARADADVRSVSVRTSTGPTPIADYLTRQQTRPVVFVIRRPVPAPGEPQGSYSVPFDNWLRPTGQPVKS